MKQLSIHRPLKQKLTKSNNFEYYLAGLIDGDGHISTIGHIVIAFNLRDKRDAYYIRSLIGFGKIREVKNKNAVNLIISNKKGIIYVANLIKDKIKHPVRIEQYNERLFSKLKLIKHKTSINNTINWKSSWFSGFCDADGHLRLYLLKRPHHKNKEIRLLCQIDQKDDILLKQIKQYFGGYLGYRKYQDTFYYSSVSYKNMYKIIKYFDKYSLQYHKTYLRYTIIRKSYIIIQNKEHLTDRGLQKLLNYQQKLKDMI